MTELPIALRPIGEVLELASGFALCVITGPRDRSDSVYLRLVRALGQEFEFVRHRVDIDDVDLLAVLRGGDASRPRAVFVTGLEYMPDGAREDAIVRLNLVRDSWASHAARVILWLPSWGLSEFRRLAPDLFHWRSKLAALHDVDLPVRDEEEYLVWVCEHLIGTWGRQRWPDAFPSILRSLRVDHRRIMPLDWAKRENRGVLTGFDPTERTRLLHDISLHAAVCRVSELDGTSSSPRDLDVLLRTGRVRIIQGDGGPDFLPLLMRAPEVAGRLQSPADWVAIARAVGVPGAETAAPMLAELAETGELCVLLDGFDLLDLRPGSSAQTWLAALAAEHPRLRILASSAADASPAFAGWSVARKRDAGPRPLASETLDALVTLLSRIFTPGELAAWFTYWFEDGGVPRPSADDTAQAAAARMIEAMATHGLLDAAFFEELKRLRPRELHSIDAIERALQRE